MLYSKKLGSIRVCAAYFFGKIGCNGRFFVFLDKNNYFFKKTLFYFFVGYFILWKSLTAHFKVIRSLRLCYHLDDLIFRSTKVKAKTCKCHHNTCNRLRLRIRNLVDELHHKVARFLVENFDGILLPTFEVSEMVLRSGRKIQSKSVRQMLTWSQYQFKIFLRSKAFEYEKTVINCCEAYRSKTGSRTGELIDNLGGKK